MLLYPQYQFVVPREGEGGEGEAGGGFWQSIINYFGTCGGGDEYFRRRTIPPPIDPTKIPGADTIDIKVPGGDTEKQGSKEKDDGIDRKPSKPFYYVLPPAPGFNYYFPQPNLFRQPITTPLKYLSSDSFRIKNAKSINSEQQVISKNDETHTEKVVISNGHANEKNVN